METKIQRINILYLLEYIFVPIIICALGFLLCYAFFRHGGTGAVVTTMVPTILAVIWWVFGGTFIFKRKTKELERRFEREGYTRNQTFYSRGKTVILDISKGTMGLIFFWNPFETYILPASRIDKTLVDTGRSGAGFMEGSSRVSFLFTIDGDIDVRVNTFTSNQRFRMDDSRITTGIAKAEHMVRCIDEARANADKSAKSNKSDKSSEAKTEKSASKSEKAAKTTEKTKATDKKSK